VEETNEKYESKYEIIVYTPYISEKLVRTCYCHTDLESQYKNYFLINYYQECMRSKLFINKFPRIVEFLFNLERTETSVGYFVSSKYHIILRI
jgi:hypothetical protein